MKAVIVYSGKGGVGKTTTTANIARLLSQQGKTVLVIDADINTPSMCTEFKGEHPEENLWVHSSGNIFDKFIYLEKAMVRKFLNMAKTKLKELKPDFVLIDTPPSITNVHIELLKVLKISHIIFVTQPTELSREDVIRTAEFFRSRCGYCPASMVENMCYEEYLDEEPVKYGIDVIARIPLMRRFDTKNLLEVAKAEFEGIIHEISKSEEVNQEDYVSPDVYDETFDILHIYHRGNNRKGYDIEILRDGEDSPKSMFVKDIHFLSVRTWDTIREFQREEEFGIKYDQRVENCTSERIGRLLDAFKDDGNAYFMVTNAPMAEIHLITGEIGLASLDTKGNYHMGMPRIKYQTSKGEITLFADEVMPANMEIIKQSLEDGYTLRSDGRYIPPKEVVRECYCAFGHRIGLCDNWEKYYDEWENE